jgi:hypothetical protein
MIKSTSPYDWPFQDAPVAHIKVAKAGMGPNDLKEFVKRAGDEAAHRFRKMAHYPGEEYLHLLAMGATEVISPNRNGDGWTERILQISHPSFSKSAWWHRNHKVEDSDGVYGRVRDDWYNRKMGRVELIVGLFGDTKSAKSANAKRGRVADKEIHMLDKGVEIPVSMSGTVPYDECFKAGTLVEAEHGMVPIESLRAGDYVRSHTGKLQKVTRVLKKPYSGTMVDIQVMGVPETISATAEHPFFVVKQESLRGCQGSTKDRNGKKVKRRHSFKSSNSCTGCKTEVKLRREWVASEDIRLGDYATCPVVPPGDFEVGAAKAYLLGLYTGDGSIIKKTRTRQGLTENIAAGLSFSLDDRWPSVTAKARTMAFSVNGRENPVYPAGEEKKSHTLYLYDADFGTDCQFLIGTFSDKKILNEEVFRLTREDRLAFLGGWVDSDGCIDTTNRKGTIRITTVSRTLAEQCKRLVNGTGFNASVVAAPNDSGYSNSESTIYTVSAGRDLWNAIAPYSAKINGALTDCRSATQTVTVDGYSHMRVQEVRHYYEECDVYNLSVEEDETYIVSGVVVHNCSGCGNKARGRKEYCKGASCKYGGLYNNIGKVFEDGHHLHAVNPETSFFDISGIFDENSLTPDRQADRIAYVMGRIKSASAAVQETPTVPWWTYENRGMWFNKQARILPTLSRFEKEASMTYGGSALTEKPVGDLRATSTMRMLNDLAKKGVCLSLADFAVVCDVPASTAVAAEYYAKTAFARLSNSWQMEDMLESNPFHFEASGELCSEKALFSMAPEAVRKRAWLDVVEERVDQKPPIIDDPVAEALSDLHAVYRLGFAASLEKSAKLDLLFNNIARHNRFQ